jgi:thiamine-monophosphate kinase
MSSQPFPSAEYELISRLQSILGNELGEYYQTGIGDDAAVRSDRNGNQLVITTDLSVDEVHFSRTYMTMEEIGYRAMVSNISDCAAMGALPDSAFIQLVFPDTVECDATSVEALYRGFGEACRAWQFPVAGGDLSRGRQWVIGITLIGRIPEGGRAMLRKGAQPGDRIWVSGIPGRSAAGLALLQARGRKYGDSRFNSVVQAHIRPVPRVELGQLLARNEQVHAMMDLSDGLSKDCRTLGFENGCDIIVRADASHLPVEMVQLSRELSQPWSDWFYHGGEDYELLFTAAPAFDPSMYAGADGGCRFVCVGECRAGSGALLVDDQGVLTPLNVRGYDHVGALLQQAERTAILRETSDAPAGAAGS